MAKTKWKKKYRMFVHSKGWISRIDNRIKMSGRRYSFYNEEDPSRAMLLSVDEAFDCMRDCKNEFNNWNYYVFPEKEFKEEFEKYKKENPELIKKIKASAKSRQNSKINISNILKPYKEYKKVSWAYISREISNSYFSDLKIYYRLATDIWASTGPVIGLKKEKGKYIFETWNSFYEVEEVKKLDYVDTIKEITNYLKSKDFKFFKKYLIESEAKEYEQLKKEAKVKLVKKKNSEEAIGIFDINE